MKRAILIRGVSGSGKSSFANQLTDLIDENICTKNICAIDYFKEYNSGIFDSDLVPKSHEWCKNRVKEFCKNNVNLIIIHNTFCSKWELMQYENILKTFDYSIRLIEVCNRSLEKPSEIPEDKWKAQYKRFTSFSKPSEPKPKLSKCQPEIKRRKIKSSKLKKPNYKLSDFGGLAQHSVAMDYY